MHPNPALMNGTTGAASADEIVPDGEPRPIVKIQKLTEDVLERLKVAATKISPLTTQEMRLVIAATANKVFAVEKPRWYRRISMDEAEIDLTDFGWGIVRIADAPPNLTDRYSAMLQKYKNSNAVQVRAVGLQSYVVGLETGPVEDPRYSKVVKPPERGHDENRWIAWIGNMTNRVVDRIEAGINVFLAEETFEGKAPAGGSPT